MKQTLRTYLAYGMVAALLVPATALADTATTPSRPAAAQQAKAIKGNVVDENGEPMIGVTVKFVGGTGDACNPRGCGGNHGPDPLRLIRREK